MFESQPLLLHSEVPAEWHHHLEKFLASGRVRCRTLKASGEAAGTRVYWINRDTALDTQIGISPHQGKRPHARFVSPLLSSRSGTKQPRLTPVNHVTTPTRNNQCEEITQPSSPKGETTQPSSQNEGNTTQPSTQETTPRSDSLLEQVRRLEEEKKMLEKTLSDSEDKLRKLKMVKLYRSKNDLDQLEALIAKWRQASQDAAERLLSVSTREPRPTMNQLLDHLHIDQSLIRYSPDNDSFY